ncbi:MAG: flagellar hook-basal body complex protein FliE [Kineosporiaceae bacterium]|nr:flagellar hook-basal body complex protein FliE [Kineosporiaceae bacterium]MBK7622144.1 flagellar hook-basal body complex protein FliE [Kineosporiaceae bacterium]MBK8074455.1 flagellar hook-basal body complex protein FliE [Kineosporiaceae bacterium]
MAVSGIGGVSAANLDRISRIYQRQAAELTATSPTSPAGRIAEAAGNRGADFGQAVSNGISSLESMDRSAAGKAVQAATGDLTDVHDYVIAATQMQTATEITTTVRNKALEAFNEIMRMPL